MRVQRWLEEEEEEEKNLGRLRWTRDHEEREN
jgi:hypothetical protein